jgi:hypothetical protein
MISRSISHPKNTLYSHFSGNIRGEYSLVSRYIRSSGETRVIHSHLYSIPSMCILHIFARRHPMTSSGRSSSRDISSTNHIYYSYEDHIFFHPDCHRYHRTSRYRHIPVGRSCLAREQKRLRYKSNESHVLS